MNQDVLRYINTKRVTKKLIAPLNQEQINSLTKVVEHYGEYAFIRNKSPLSLRTIENTIPTMLANGIITIYENLKLLPTTVKNSYEHYVLLYGVNAANVYNHRTAKSILTLENFISRHGEVIGTEKYNSLLSKRSTQNTLENFISRHGEVIGTEKYNKFKNKLKYKNTLACYTEIYGPDIGEQLYNERYPSDYDLSVFQDYKKAVYKLSNTMYHRYKDQINPLNYPRTRMGVVDGWQLDHIKPINECFKEGLSIEEAADINNLRMLPWRENLMRNFNV